MFIISHHLNEREKQVTCGVEGNKVEGRGCKEFYRAEILKDASTRAAEEIILGTSKS